MVVLALALAPLLWFSVSLREPGPPVGHLRLCNRSLTEAVARTTARSPTFEGLVRRIEELPVIVYVRVAPCPHGVRSCLHFLGSDAGIRTVRISIGRLPLAPAEAAGLLAHELQHATEVGNATEVVDLASFGRFFERVGWRGRAGYETGACHLVARQVEREYVAGKGVRPSHP